MSVHTANQNKDLLQRLLSDNVTFQQKIKDLELVIIEGETLIAELKKQNLKINIENGKLIMQKNNISKELKEKEILLEQLIKDRELEIYDLNQKIILHEATINHLSQINVELTTKNKMLSNTSKILLRQNSEHFENKKLLLSQIEQLSIQNKGLIDKDFLLSSQISSYYKENQSLIGQLTHTHSQLIQTQEKLQMVEKREESLAYSNVATYIKLIKQIEELKQKA